MVYKNDSLHNKFRGRSSVIGKLRMRRFTTILVVKRLHAYKRQRLLKGLLLEIHVKIKTETTYHSYIYLYRQSDRPPFLFISLVLKWKRIE